MKIKNNSGISLITLAITIIVLIIMSAVAISGSMSMIDDSSTAKESADAAQDDDVIRSLLTYAITDEELKEGIALVNGSLVVIGSGDKEYGSGYYLIPGGTDDEIREISNKTGNANIKKYKNLTAPYVVDYDNGKFERLTEVRFK